MPSKAERKWFPNLYKQICTNLRTAPTPKGHRTRCTPLLVLQAKILVSESHKMSKLFSTLITIMASLVEVF